LPKRPVRYCREASSSPARPRPGERSAPRQQWLFHSIAGQNRRTIMQTFSWLRKQLGSSHQRLKGRASRTKPAPRVRLRLEPLEGRLVPAGGVLDPTFGTAGVAGSLLDNLVPGAVTTYPQAGTANDGKIVVAGTYYGPNSFSQFGIVRHNLDGSLDKS